jgi:hypothetical protein
MSDFAKSPAIESLQPTDTYSSSTSDDKQAKRTQSITTNPDGSTVIVKQDGETVTIDKHAERALLWQFDLRILPLLTMMYLFNALDKSNLGNAKTAGLEEDLGFAGTNKCECEYM